MNRATASYHGRPFYDCIRYKYEIGSAAGACHGAQFQNDIEISVSYAKPLLFSISASTEQHGFLRVLGIFTNGPKQQRDCILFVKWLDGAFAHPQRKIWAQHLQATPPSIQMHWLHDRRQELQHKQKCICICSCVRGQCPCAGLVATRPN